MDFEPSSLARDVASAAYRSVLGLSVIKTAKTEHRSVNAYDIKSIWFNNLIGHDASEYP